MSTADSDGLLTLQEAADYLKITVRKLRDLCDSKYGKCKTVARNIKIPHIRLDRYILAG
jgi:hypothetical protein